MAREEIGVVGWPPPHHRDTCRASAVGENCGFSVIRENWLPLPVLLGPHLFVHKRSWAASLQQGLNKYNPERTLLLQKIFSRYRKVEVL